MDPYIPETLPLETIDWVGCIGLVARANYALSEYNASLRSLPNPGLLLAPLETKEAILSSQIEGTIATLDEVYQFQADYNKPTDQLRIDELREIVNYRKAVRLANEFLAEGIFSTHLIRSIHQILLDSVRGATKEPGKVRESQNYIGNKGTGMEGVKYTPPPPHLVSQCLENLISYMNSNEQDRISQSGIIHAQFEIIHPFMDGNGRTGRILIPLFLRNKKMLDHPSFYISEYFDNNRDEYVHRLNSLSLTKDWNGWIKFYLNAVTEQSNRGVSKIRSILALYNSTSELISFSLKTKHVNEMLRFLFSSPYFSSVSFVEFGGIPAATAKRLLRQLVERSIIMQIQPGKPGHPGIYAFHSLIHQLSD